MSNTNRITEISAFILAALIVIGGVVLFYVGKITYVEFPFFIVTAVGLIGYNAALKAPSPAQMQQLNSQQQQIASVQELALNAANAMQAHQAQDHAPTPAPATQQPVQQVPFPVQLAPTATTTAAVSSSFTDLEMPAVQARQ